MTQRMIQRIDSETESMTQRMIQRIDSEIDSMNQRMTQGEEKEGEEEEETINQMIRRRVGHKKSVSITTKKTQLLEEEYSDSNIESVKRRLSSDPDWPPRQSIFENPVRRQRILQRRGGVYVEMGKPNDRNYVSDDELQPLPPYYR